MEQPHHKGWNVHEKDTALRAAEAATWQTAGAHEPSACLASCIRLRPTKTRSLPPSVRPAGTSALPQPLLRGRYGSPVPTSAQVSRISRSSPESVEFIGVCNYVRGRPAFPPPVDEAPHRFRPRSPAESGGSGGKRRFEAQEKAAEETTVDGARTREVQPSVRGFHR